MQEITIALGKTLKEWRRVNKKSQREVAEQLMVRQEQVSKFELGRAISDEATFSLSKFVQAHCLDEKRSDALNAQREPERKEATHLPVKRGSYEQIIEWLYMNDDAFGSKNEWRKAFITFLKEVL